MNKIISFLKGIFERDIQAIGIKKEVQTLQLERLLELKNTLNSSKWADEEFRGKFLDEMNKNILRYQNEINSLEKRLSKDEKRELRNWHCILKSFTLSK